MSQPALRIERRGYVTILEKRRPNFTPAAVIAASQSANLDRCANGPLAHPDASPCRSAREWVNGNLNASRPHDVEDDAVAYRMRVGGLSLGRTP